MNFVSTGFAFFFLIVLITWWASSKTPGARPGLLLLFNLFFYASAGLTFLPLLIATSLMNWAAARRMADPRQSARRKFWLLAGVAGNVGLLAFFKYYEFLMVTLAEALIPVGVHLPLHLILPPFLSDMAFPIGISFYSFQGIAYIVQQYSLPEQSPQPFFRVLTFLSFFPTVLAGPILRPGQFFPQLVALSAAPASSPPLLPQRPSLREKKRKSKKNRIKAASAMAAASPAMADARRADAEARAAPQEQGGPVALTRHDVQEAFALLLSGLFKKVVLSSYLADHVVRDAFQGPEGYSSWGILVAVYGYSMQIYCDFSGYTDLALGVGRLMGFHLPQNFASPYLARNLQEFWRRWHITLSSWLRDYLYIPLGGSRTGHRYRNLFVTMLLGGLWHGAHTRFLIWGALHGLGLGIVHALQSFKTRRGSPSAAPVAKGPLPWLGTVFSWLLTFHFVTLAWIFFGAENTDRALEILRRLICWGQVGQGFPFMALPVIFCTLALQLLGKDLMRGFLFVQTRLPLVAQGAVIAVICSLILRMGPDGVLPFIYFQF